MNTQDNLNLNDDINPINEEQFHVSGEEKIELVKEFLNVSKKEITETRTFEKFVEERQVEIPIDLMSQEVSIERLPRNEEVTEKPMIQELDGKTIIPIIREEVVVTKRLILVEEIIITKIENHQKEIITETLREGKFRENK